MAQQHSAGRFLATVFTVIGLGLVWFAVVISLPSREELSAKEVPVAQRAGAVPVSKPASEPTLDLSIPGVPSVPPAPPEAASGQEPVQANGASVPNGAQLDPRAAQIARLHCEADIQQLCPDTLDGPARAHCFKQRGSQLAAPCQQQLRERFVKWKEERGRMIAACQEDVKRWCSSVKIGGGQVVQCLQEHAQEVSDRCYETLPKGTVYFKQ